MRLCSFIALLLAAVLILINTILRWCGIEIGGPIIGALTLVKDIALLIGIAFAAWSFARAGGKTTTIIFWVAIVVYVASAICGLF